MSDDTVVHLTWHETAMAATIAVNRQISALYKRSPNAFGLTNAGWSEQVEGACGEVAVAKFLGIFWNGSVNTYATPDLDGIQVRTRSKDDYELIVRPKDSDDEIFVLVTGVCPDFRIRGWMRGGSAKRQEWVKEYGNRPPAYFVPTESLEPATLLKKQMFPHYD